MNPCESQSANYMTSVKKCQLFEKKYKIDNQSGVRPSKTHFASLFSILSTLLHCDRKNSIFFKKLRLFCIDIRLDTFASSLRKLCFREIISFRDISVRVLRIV